MAVSLPWAAALPGEDVRSGERRIGAAPNLGGWHDRVVGERRRSSWARGKKHVSPGSTRISRTTTWPQEPPRTRTSRGRGGGYEGTVPGQGGRQRDGTGARGRHGAVGPPSVGGGQTFAPSTWDPGYNSINHGGINRHGVRGSRRGSLGRRAPAWRDGGAPRPRRRRGASPGRRGSPPPGRPTCPPGLATRSRPGTEAS